MCLYVSYPEVSGQVVVYSLRYVQCDFKPTEIEPLSGFFFVLLYTPESTGVIHIKPLCGFGRFLFITRFEVWQNHTEYGR